MAHTTGLTGSGLMRDDADAVGPDGLQARWQAARLAAATATLRRLGHDLRGILAPALLAVERLEDHSDAAVRRAAETAIRAIERATAALGAAMQDSRGAESRPLLALSLRDALEPSFGALAARAVPGDALVLADAAIAREAVASVLRHLGPRGGAPTALAARREQASWVVSVSCGEAAGMGGGDAPVSELAVAREWLRALGGGLRVEPGAVEITLRAA